ncbi:MAG TPA: toll/interleukin-1 receptor domain-containing protein [Thermoleophilaceae bacterium]|nr:toll/interleukin-1 receptor domain-containing protein [Thermoleophilaceae bacterium]
MSAGPTESGSVPGPKVFITYRRDETAAHAGRLYDAMVARFGEDNVFMDVDMAPGVDFVERIREAVAACHVLIVVMGPKWATVEDERGTARLADPEDFVRLEVETALRRPDVTPIPVLVAGARMPNRNDLPPEIRAITRRNALELSDPRWRYDVGRLISALDQLLAEMPVGGGTTAPQRSIATRKPGPAPGDTVPGAGETAPPPKVAATTSAKSKPAAPWTGGGRRQRWALLGVAAIAAIVVAVVLTANSDGGNGAADGGGDTSANQETGDPQALLNSLPASIRESCRDDPTEQWMVEESEALAQVNCESAEVGNDYLTYGRWESPTKAREWLKDAKKFYSSSSSTDPCSSRIKTSMQMELPQAESACVDIVKKGDSGIVMVWNEDQSPVAGNFHLIDNHNQDTALKKWEEVVKAP